MDFVQDYYAKRSDKVEPGELFYFFAGEKHLAVCCSLNEVKLFVHLANIAEDGEVTASNRNFLATILNNDLVGLSFGANWYIGYEAFKQNVAQHIPSKYGYLVISEADRFLEVQIIEQGWHNQAWLNLETFKIQKERPEDALVFSRWELWDSKKSAAVGRPPLLTV